MHVGRLVTSLIKSEYNVPDDAFMTLEFSAGSLTGKAGTIRYHASFANV